MDDQKTIEEAVHYIKEHKEELIERFASPQVFISDAQPISLFMAGSPGAGKTEVSKRLLEQFIGKLPVRIDADDIRTMFRNYTGVNAHLFQRACTTGVNKLFDYVLEQNINVILDGTFAYERAIENISRSLKHHRRVIIYYLFQDPLIAWRFTQIREQKEGRRVSKEVFISAFVKARENVNQAKADFGQSIELNVVIKNYTSQLENIFPNVDSIDGYLPKVYTHDELETLL